MSKRILEFLICLVSAIPFGFAYGQGDGECTVPLSLPNEIVGEMQDILSTTTSGFGPAEHGIASPFVTVSPVADGVVGQGEYPNACHYSFADRENPGNPYPGEDNIEPVNGSEENDLHLDLHLAHTDQFIFFGFEVTDEFLDVEEGSRAWNNDGVELFLNADLEIGDGNGASLEAYKVIGDVTGNGDVTLNNRESRHNILEPVSAVPPTDDQFFSAGVPSATGWVVEFQLPLAALDADSDDGLTLEPAKTGDVLLINFAVNDIDSQGGVQGDPSATHAQLWLVEDDPRSPQQGGEEVWVVPLGLTEAVEQRPRLQSGDADQDLDFDQLDLVKTQMAAKYLSGQAATWGEGDWNGAPGGEQGNPPAGNGFFDQFDIISALAPGHYLTGPYAAIRAGGSTGDGQTSVVYNAGTGEVAVDAPAGVELTSINIDAAGAVFTGDAAQNLGGSFDNDADNNIFKATFGDSFGSLSFGRVAQAGLSEEFLLGDLTVVGSLDGGGGLGDVDLVYIPESSTIALALVGLLSAVGARRRKPRI